MENKSICGNCRHFNPTSTVVKTLGKCENEKNQVMTLGINILVNTYVTDEQGREELKAMLDDGIRYPEDFGCIFFEPREEREDFFKGLENTAFFTGG